MWSSYQEMHLNIDNEKMLIDKRLEMVRFANKVRKEILNYETMKLFIYIKLYYLDLKLRYLDKKLDKLRERYKREYLGLY